MSLPELVNHLIIITARLGPQIPTKETTTEPVLCMAGKECGKDDASKFLNLGTSCPDHPVLLKPTVWIRCGWKKCKQIVEKEICLSKPPLSKFIASCPPNQVEPHITTKAPRPASRISSSHSSDRTIQVNEISFAVQYPLSKDRLWPATARFTVGPTKLYSTIGGPIYIDGKMFGLTTAHSIVSYLEQIAKEVKPSDDEPSDDESLASDSDSEITSTSSSKRSNEVSSSSEANAQPALNSSDIEVDEPSQAKWEISKLPNIVAYLGRGTSTGDYSFKENAPTTSDFALIDLQSDSHRLHSTTNIVSLKDALPPGGVRIATTAASSPLKGYLLKDKSFLIMRGAVMQTMKIQIESPARAYTPM